MQNASDRQLGGIMVFVIVGLVLAVLFGGAIYASKQQGRVASQSGTVATNDQKSGDTSSGTANDTNKDSSKNESSTNSGSTDQAPSSSSNQPSSSDSSQSQASGSSSNSSVATTGPSHITATGPEDVIMPGLGLALLAAGIVAYRRSSVAFRIQALKQ